MTENQPPISNTIPSHAWQQIAAWLAAADVDGIEIETGIEELRMVRGRQGYQLQAAGSQIAAPVLASDIPLAVTARVAGVFLTQHPAGGAQLPIQGDHVQAGQLLALLQIGLLLTPVLAPMTGIRGRCLLAAGEQAGYGARLIEILAGDA
jgi:acetyl-CoA carboxylase biotin carboxyl carrier protein